MKSRIATLFVSLLAIAATTRAQGPPPLGAPLPGLTPEQLARFQAGRDEFLRAFTPNEGLGPVFNDRSCLACHSQPAPGGGSPRLVTRFGLARGRSFDPLEGLGGSLIQDRGLGRVGACDIPGEVVPEEANLEARRRTTALFGLGLVDAVSDASLEALAREQQALAKATAGRVHGVVDPASGEPRVGRFGWKAQVATLETFSGDALLNEMGITNPLFRDESCPQGDCALLSCNPAPGLNDDGTALARLTDFQLLLAPPPPGPMGPAERAGETVFAAIGCAACHTPTLVTGPHPIAALDQVEFHPYSDFLLHDMGQLGDGIVQGEAAGAEMRTAPLWGTGRQGRWLHDGRALSLEEAVLGHAGQASSSRRRYARLSDADRAALLAFLRSL